MKPFLHSLMLITDRKLVPGEALAQAVRQAVEGGVRCIQLREKDLDRESLKSLALSLIPIVQSRGASLIINGDGGLVLEVNAQGVHLPSSGPPAAEMRTILAENRWIGRSAHSLEEANQAEYEGADYVVFGPIFETPSKKSYGPPVGLKALHDVAASVEIPVLAVGGITLENIEQALQAGASGAAVIRGILAAPDITQAASEFIRKVPKRC